MIEEKSSEMVETLDTMELVEGKPMKVTNIGANLGPNMKKRYSRIPEKEPGRVRLEP